MRALHLSEGQLEFRSDWVPTVENRKLIEVRVLHAGVCETDLQLKQGYMNFTGILGHEFVGVAESGTFAGQRVVGEINCACHNCELCKTVGPRHCSNRTVIGILNHDGAFADSVYVPEENLHVVPEHVPNNHAVFTEPVAAACRILEQVTIGSSDRLVIFGDGRLGNLCAQVLQANQCRPTVVGKHESKLTLLASRGIDTCHLDDFEFNSDADYVVDCTGSTTGFDSALKTVKPCGTVILKTTVAARHHVPLSPIVIDEITVLGSRCGPFQPALKLLADEAIDVASLITAEYPLENAIKAFEQAEQSQTLKVLLSVAE